MATLTALRQELGYSLGEITVGVQQQAFSPNVPLVSIITDTSLIDPLTDESRYRGAWAYQIGNRAERRIIAFNPDEGKFTLARPWDRVPAGHYEIHQLLPATQLNRLINQALTSIEYTDSLDLPVVSGAIEYDLGAYNYLIEPSQIYAVEFGQANSGDEITYFPLVRWHLSVGDALTLHIEPYGEGPGNVLRLKFLRTYDALNTESATTTCPTAWALAVTRPLVFERLMRTAPAEDAQRYEREWARESANQARMAPRYLPRVNRQVKHRRTANPRDSRIVRWP